MVREALIHGLGDEEICMNVLGQHKHDMSLDKVLQYIGAKESGKHSAGCLLEGIATTTAASSSSYKHQEKPKTQPCDSNPQPYVTTADRQVTHATNRMA